MGWFPARAPTLPSLRQILAEEALRREQFPVVQHRLYFAHAAVAPLPHLVVEAMTGYLARASEEGQFGHLHEEILRQTRALAARLLETTPEEIAFVTSTSTGLSLVAGGIAWRPGENVIIPEGDFPANLHPWLALQHRGVEIRFVPHLPDRGITVDDITALIDERTRLVSLSSMHHLTGHATDLAGIGDLLRQRGTLFAVDAIQSLGALPVSARHADFVTAGAHKWLLGPQGIGLLCVNRRRLTELQPILLGWKSVPDTAERYEPGTLNVVGIAGLGAALSLLEAMGWTAVAERIVALHRRLGEGLAALGYEALGRPSAARRTCITSFKHPHRDLAQLRRKLEGRALPIILSERRDAAGAVMLRFAPHFYALEAEVDALLDGLS